MRSSRVHFTLFVGVCLLVASGIGATQAVIENETGIDTRFRAVLPNDPSLGSLVHTSPLHSHVTSGDPATPPGTSFYLEEFTTTTYQDVPNTNASGWGSATLLLPHRSPTIACTYDTPSEAWGVFVAGDSAYVADGESGLQVIDISVPSQPVLAGSCDTPGWALNVFVSGDIAYVADWWSGLQVINVTIPSQPRLVGSISGFALAVFVSGDFAFVANGESGFKVVNVTVPSQPVLAGSCDTPGWASGVFVSGDFAYVGDSSSGLHVFNITVPTQPMLVGSYDTPGNAGEVFVCGDSAYVADWLSGLQVINITNPANPSWEGSYNTPSAASGVYVVGGLAYVADGASGLLVINVTTPSRPSLAGSCDTPDTAKDVWVWGNYAYVSDIAAFQVVKISDFTSPVYAGACGTPTSARGVSVDGSLAYLADFGSGLLVINVTVPSQPKLVGSCDIPGNMAQEVFVCGDFVYITDIQFGLLVVNVTIPTQPRLVGSYDTLDEARGVFVSGDFAYVTDFGSGLLVINVANPSQPVLAGSCDTPGWASGVFVSGDVAYVADSSSGLHVFNITVPTQPSLAGSYNTPGYAYEVFVSGDIAYVADYYGLQVVNVTVPSQPSLAGSYDTPGYAYGVFVNGDMAYVADYESGLQVINVTVPSQPSLAGSYNTPGWAEHVCTCGDFAYVGDGSSGLQVVEMTWNRCRQFEPKAVAQSLHVFDALSASLESATLSAQHSTQNNTMVEYYLSADNGFHWEPVNPGVERVFVYPGKQLMWRAVLTSSYPMETPTVFSLLVTYVIRLDAPILLAPNDGASITDGTPTFQWEMVSGAASYLLQLDRVASFDSPDLINATVVSITYVPESALVDGMWFWRVMARDINGDWSAFSSPRSLDIETGLPSWDQVPTYQVIEFGFPFRYDLNASDPSGLDHWWLNDTGHFAIDGTGVIANMTRLSVGRYGLQVWVNDTYGNTLTRVFPVNVEDTTAPTWDQIPTHQSVPVGTRFCYDISASDLSGIRDYWINDTTHFIIDGNGLISDAHDLSIGIYWVIVRAYDPYDHHCEAAFNVTVYGALADTQPPTWVTAPANQALEYGTVLDYQVAASDPSGLDVWWLNDTSVFSMGGNGRITSIGVLTPGAFGVRVWVNDTCGNVLTGTFTVFIRDTTSPTWIQTPATQTLEFGDTFFYDVDASDLSGIDHYWINDTTHFLINGNGGITNATRLAVGNYWLEVRAYDPYNHYCGTVFVVSVQEGTSTSLPEAFPPWMTLAIATGSFIGGAAFIGGGAYVLMRRRRKPP